MVRFYMDEHVPGPITQQLRRRGVDVLTVQEDGNTGLPDPQVLDRAAEIQRVVFTQDEDFLAEAKQRQEAGQFFIGVVYVKQRKLTIGECVADLELIATASELAEYANTVFYLPLRL